MRLQCEAESPWGLDFNATAAEADLRRAVQRGHARAIRTISEKWRRRADHSQSSDRNGGPLSAEAFSQEALGRSVVTAAVAGQHATVGALVRFLGAPDDVGDDELANDVVSRALKWWTEVESAISSANVVELALFLRQFNLAIRPLKLSERWRTMKLGKDCTYTGQTIFDDSVGDFVPHGLGSMVFRNVNDPNDIDRFDGGWANGDREGLGAYRYYSDGYYLGQYWKDRKHGKGVRVWHNGDRYDGDWNFGERHGNGALKYTNGRSYVGGFAHLRRSGYGVFVWEDGHKYSGMWANGERNGKGVYIVPEGARFEGEYLNGQRHGHGIEVFQDGERWEGTWVADELNGRGSKTLPGGKCLEGRWVDGTFFEDRQ